MVLVLIINITIVFVSKNGSHVAQAGLLFYMYPNDDLELVPLQPFYLPVLGFQGCNHLVCKALGINHRAA